MTRFASPMVIACPHCDGHLLKSQLASFSYRTVRSWTDGKTDIDTYSMFISLMRCPLCQKSFWKSDAKELGYLPLKPRPMSRSEIWYAKLTGDKEKKIAGQEDWNNIPILMKEAPHAMRPDYSDWLILLHDTSTLTKEWEITTRRTVWQFSSDHLRLRSDGIPCRPVALLTDAWATENRLALLALHENGTITSIIEKTELLRQLGRFDDAVKAFDSASQEDRQTPRATRIIALARSGDVVVRDV